MATIIGNVDAMTKKLLIYHAALSTLVEEGNLDYEILNTIFNDLTTEVDTVKKILSNEKQPAENK